MDRTGLKILENNKNIQSIISVNTNILLRRFRLKFLRIMCSTSCYKERVNFENTLYYKAIPSTKKTFLILNQLWRNSILHCENENLIKADWLTMWVLEMFHPINISLAESDSDRYGKRFSILVIV
jgi:hypothetical protein